MSDEYTPTTEQVRGAFIAGRTAGMPMGFASDFQREQVAAKTAEFDRWLAKHDAEVRLRYKMERTGNYK